MLLRFHKKKLIETDSSSSDSDNDNQDTLVLVDHSNPIIRLYQYRKIIRLIKNFDKQKITSLDRKAIEGIFISKIKDFKE